MIQADQQPFGVQPAGDRDGVSGLVSGHVAGHDAAGQRRRGDKLTHPAAVRGGEQNAAQHGTLPGLWLAATEAALPAAGLRYPAGPGDNPGGAGAARRRTPRARAVAPGQSPGRASTLRRLSEIVTFAPASGGTMTSCAAGTPPARSAASTGTVRLISASPMGPSSKCRATEPVNPTVVPSLVTASPCPGSRSSLPSRCKNTSLRGGWPRLCTRATVSWPR